MSRLMSLESVSIDGFILHIIGLQFLNNVMAAFSFGKNEIRFAKRVDSAEDKSWNDGEGKDSTPLADAAGKMRDASWAGVDAFLVDVNH